MRTGTTQKVNQVKTLLKKGATLGDALKATRLSSTTYYKSKNTKPTTRTTRATKATTTLPTERVCILIGDATQLLRVLNQVA